MRGDRLQLFLNAVGVAGPARRGRERLFFGTYVCMRALWRVLKKTNGIGLWFSANNTSYMQWTGAATAENSTPKGGAWCRDGTVQFTKKQHDRAVLSTTWLARPRGFERPRPALFAGSISWMSNATPHLGPPATASRGSPRSPPP